MRKLVLEEKRTKYTNINSWWFKVLELQGALENCLFYLLNSSTYNRQNPEK